MVENEELPGSSHSRLSPVNQVRVHQVNPGAQKPDVGAQSPERVPRRPDSPPPPPPAPSPPASGGSSNPFRVDEVLENV